MARPSLAVLGGEDGDPVAVARDLTPWWAEKLRTLPSDEFPRPAWLKARMLESLLRRGWLEQTGRVVGGAWVYRFTAFGRAVRTAL